MKAFASPGAREPPSAEAASAASEQAGAPRSSSNEFRDLLGRALGPSSPLSHAPDGQAEHAGGPPSLDARSQARAAGGLGAEEIGAAAAAQAPGANALHVDGDPGEEPGASSLRPSRRKRRPDDAGPDLPGQGHARAAHATLPAARGAAGSEGTSGKAIAPRAVTALLASASAARQPPTTGAAAKPTATRPAAHQDDREKPREREVARAAERSPPPSRPEQAALPAAAEAKTIPRSSAPQAADRPAPPLPPPRPGQEVGGAVLRHAAHLRVETGALGALSLHLRVREGALHLRVDGDAAGVVEARAGELSQALAGEGLRLAPIEITSRQGAGVQRGAAGDAGRPGEERREAWNEAADGRGARPGRTRRSPSRRPDAAAGSGAHRPIPRGVHVKA